MFFHSDLGKELSQTGCYALVDSRLSWEMCCIIQDSLSERRTEVEGLKNTIAIARVAKVLKAEISFVLGQLLDYFVRFARALPHPSPAVNRPKGSGFICPNKTDILMHDPLSSWATMGPKYSRFLSPEFPSKAVAQIRLFPRPLSTELRKAHWFHLK